MKKDNNKKRWFYDLTEKQVYKIVAVFEVIFFIITVSYIVTNWSNRQLLVQREKETMVGIIFTIGLLFCDKVLGIKEGEGLLIDGYQNKGRFLYKYAGSFLEEAMY